MDNRAGHNIGDETITEERKDYNRDGQKETGFASSVVPTLEEKVVSEQNAQTNQKEGADATDAIGESFQSRNENAPNGHRVSSDSSSDLHAGDNTLYGAPANAKSPVSDDEPPARSLKSDFDDEELAAPGARAIIRENLGGKSSRRRPWTVPTTKPRVEPQDFEDPISDAFWKDMWVASAVHNVSRQHLILDLFLPSHAKSMTDETFFVFYRRRSIARFFMLSRMILSLLGSSIRNLWPIMTA